MIKKILMLSAAMTVSTIAVAGSTENKEVVINFDQAGNEISASGVLSAARHSVDDTQFIGCKLHDDQLGSWAQCIAHDATGNSVWCETTDPAKLQTIAALKADSQLFFAWVVDPEEGPICTDISVNTSSIYLR